MEGGTQMIKMISAILLGILMLSLASAVSLNSVFAEDLLPGGQGKIRIEIENTLDRDVKDVSLRLDFGSLPLNPIGGSEESVDGIDEDDEEEFVFTVKAANDIKPGDYKIPYIISYNDDGVEKTRSGSVGITVNSNAELEFSISVDNPIIGEQGVLRVKIVNKGFADAKFLSMRIIPEGYRLLSEREVYIGTVDSDDFETANFDVIFENVKPNFIAFVEFKDFDNEKMTKSVNLPITVYTIKEATDLGIIKKSNAPVIVFVVITVLLVWILWRVLKRYLRNSKKKKER
jgi:hypothetical protein